MKQPEISFEELRNSLAYLSIDLIYHGFLTQTQAQTQHQFEIQHLPLGNLS